MGTVTTDRQENSAPQQLTEDSPNQNKELYLKAYLNSKGNDPKNKQEYQKNDTTHRDCVSLILPAPTRSR
jgi:hypothetical protein